MVGLFQGRSQVIWLQSEALQPLGEWAQKGASVMLLTRPDRTGFRELGVHRISAFRAPPAFGRRPSTQDGEEIRRAEFPLGPQLGRDEGSGWWRRDETR